MTKVNSTLQEESILYVNDYSDGPTTFAQLEEYRDERGHEMYVLNRAKPVLPPAPPTAVSTTNLGCPAPSDTSSHTLSSGPGQTVTPTLAPNKQQQQQQPEVDIRTMRRMAGEGGEAEPVITSEAEGMFLNHTGLFMDSQIAYEIHCWRGGGQNPLLHRGCVGVCVCVCVYVCVWSRGEQMCSFLWKDFLSSRLIHSSGLSLEKLYRQGRAHNLVETNSSEASQWTVCELACQNIRGIGQSKALYCRQVKWSQVWAAHHWTVLYRKLLVSIYQSSFHRRTFHCHRCSGVDVCPLKTSHKAQ